MISKLAPLQSASTGSFASAVTPAPADHHTSGLARHMSPAFCPSAAAEGGAAGPRSWGPVRSSGNGHQRPGQPTSMATGAAADYDCLLGEGLRWVVVPSQGSVLSGDGQDRT